MCLNLVKSYFGFIISSCKWINGRRTDAKTKHYFCRDVIWCLLCLPVLWWMRGMFISSCFGGFSFFGTIFGAVGALHGGAMIYGAQKHVAADIHKTQKVIEDAINPKAQGLIAQAMNYVDNATSAIMSGSTSMIESILGIVPGITWCLETGSWVAQKLLEIFGNHDKIVKSEAFKKSEREGFKNSGSPGRDAEGNVSPGHRDPESPADESPNPSPLPNAANTRSLGDAVDTPPKRSWWSTVLWTLGIGSIATAGATTGYAKYRHDTWDPRAAFDVHSDKDKPKQSKGQKVGEYLSAAKTWTTKTWTALPKWVQVAIPLVFTLGLGYWFWPSKKQSEVSKDTSTRSIWDCFSNRSGNKSSDKKSVSMPLGIVVLIGALVILLIVGAVLFFSEGSESDDDPEEDQYEDCNQMV